MSNQQVKLSMILTSRGFTPAMAVSITSNLDKILERSDNLALRLIGESLIELSKPAKLSVAPSDTE